MAKNKRVTYKGTVIKNIEDEEHELCIMERISECSFSLSNAQFMVLDLLSEKVFKRSECFTKAELDEVEALDEMQEDLGRMYKVLQDILKRFLRFHQFKAGSSLCKCYEEYVGMDTLYFQCPECRMLEDI